MVVYAGKETRA